MRLRITKRRLLFAVIIGIALLFVGLEFFLFSPDFRQLVVGGAEGVGADGTLASLAGDTDKDVREVAQKAIVRRGEKAVPSLVQRLDHPDAEDRTVAAFLLGRIGAPARPSLPVLKQRMWHDPDKGVRTVAADAINAIAGGDPETISEFVRLLAGGEEDGRVLAAKVLSGYGDQATVVPALALALRDPVPRVRQEAAEALEQIGPKAKQAVPALIEATRDHDNGVRKEVGEALERISDGLSERDAPLRASARKALDQMKNEKAKSPQD